MTHANAPLDIEGRRRLVEPCHTRPIAHVAAEAGVSRACLSKWKNRYDTHGEVGLQDRPSVPRSSPTNAKRWDAQSGTYDMGFRDYNPGLLCGACFFGKFNPGHDMAILLMAGFLESTEPKGGGQVSYSLDATGGLTDPRNIIQGGSKKNPGKEDGKADLLHWTDNAVYVWDAKHAGESAAAGGAKEVQHYMKYLRKQLRAAGDNRAVRAGFALPTQEGVNFAKPSEWVTAKSSSRPKSSSVIAYTTRNIQRTDPLPETVPETVTAPATNTNPGLIKSFVYLGSGIVVGAGTAADDVIGIGNGRRSGRIHDIRRPDNQGAGRHLRIAWNEVACAARAVICFTDRSGRIRSDTQREMGVSMGMSIRLRRVDASEMEQGVEHLERGFAATLKNCKWQQETDAGVLVDLGDPGSSSTAHWPTAISIR